VKSFFTQGVAVLFEQVPTLDVIEAVLGRVVLKRNEVGTAMFSGPSLLVGFRPEVNGLIQIDIVDRPWPDDMGSPNGDPELFAAWSMGHFGPFTYPGNLERACSSATKWQDGSRAAVARHRAFVRIRLSYVFGAAEDSLTRPADCDPAAELVAVTEMAGLIGRASGALAYFNPNAEVIMPPGELAETITFAAAHSRIPIEAWAQVRIVNLDGMADGWMMMDTVGLAQLDLPDFEAVFPAGRFDPNAVYMCLLNLGLYVAGAGDVFEEGHTTEGPSGSLLRTRRFEQALMAPPRPTVRLFDDEVRKTPKKLLAKAFGAPS